MLDLSDHPALPAEPVNGPPASRPALPLSEKAMHGPLWRSAFESGIQGVTGTPCSAGPRYATDTLERLVDKIAPDRSVSAACAWLEAQAAAFAKIWAGKNPGKGLTPDGLERWIGDGRPEPRTLETLKSERADVGYSPPPKTVSDVEMRESRELDRRWDATPIAERVAPIASVLAALEGRQEAS